MGPTRSGFDSQFNHSRQYAHHHHHNNHCDYRTNPRLTAVAAPKPLQTGSLKAESGALLDDASALITRRGAANQKTGWGSTGASSSSSVEQPIVGGAVGKDVDEKTESVMTSPQNESEQRLGDRTADASFCWDSREHQRVSHYMDREDQEEHYRRQTPTNESYNRHEHGTMRPYHPRDTRAYARDDSRQPGCNGFDGRAWARSRRQARETFDDRDNFPSPPRHRHREVPVMGKDEKCEGDYRGREASESLHRERRHTKNFSREHPERWRGPSAAAMGEDRDVNPHHQEGSEAQTSHEIQLSEIEPTGYHEHEPTSDHNPVSSQPESPLGDPAGSHAEAAKPLPSVFETPAPDEATDEEERERRRKALALEQQQIILRQVEAARAAKCARRKSKQTRTKDSIDSHDTQKEFMTAKSERSPEAERVAVLMLEHKKSRAPRTMGRLFKRLPDGSVINADGDDGAENKPNDQDVVVVESHSEAQAADDEITDDRSATTTSTTDQKFTPAPVPAVSAWVKGPPRGILPTRPEQSPPSEVAKERFDFDGSKQKEPDGSKTQALSDAGGVTVEADDEVDDEESSGETDESSPRKIPVVSKSGNWKRNHRSKNEKTRGNQRSEHSKQSRVRKNNFRNIRGGAQRKPSWRSKNGSDQSGETTQGSDRAEANSRQHQDAPSSQDAHSRRDNERKKSGRFKKHSSKPLSGARRTRKHQVAAAKH